MWSWEEGADKEMMGSGISALGDRRVKATATRLLLGVEVDFGTMKLGWNSERELSRWRSFVSYVRKEVRAARMRVFLSF
ncbi:hypothetical protein MA16_Dca020258 [Dendrobium catenatum]|uniref:Uncharacterized protein n=1 Tax=Dendrobium catenatum TaxID=906689 RepID=A0A2I0WAY5_9ASPA|nr:hypothetical protein MA16_Dca020258 [Dendrobium catenatum]